MFFTNPTANYKAVADYTNMSIPDVENLDIFEYWGLLHDAWIYNCSQTEHGREYLENAYYYSQTKPDRQALRKLFGGGSHGKQ